jgi:hypothetical protein
MPSDDASFIRSYDDATESKTSFTRDSFSCSGTVLNPKDVVRELGVLDGDGDGDDPWEVIHRIEFADPFLAKESCKFRKTDGLNIFIVEPSLNAGCKQVTRDQYDRKLEQFLSSAPPRDQCP